MSRRIQNLKYKSRESECWTLPGGENECFLTEGLLLMVSDGRVVLAVRGVWSTLPGVRMMSGAELSSSDPGDDDRELSLLFRSPLNSFRLRVELDNILLLGS